MSGREQVTDQRTRLDKSHNGRSESKQNLTLVDRRSGEPFKNMVWAECWREPGEENVLQKQSANNDGVPLFRGHRLLYFCLFLSCENES